MANINITYLYYQFDPIVQTVINFIIIYPINNYARKTDELLFINYYKKALIYSKIK